MNKKWLAIGSALVLSIGAAACSDSKDDNSSSESASQDSTAGSETASTDQDFSGSSDSKFCQTARRLEKEASALDNLGDTPTPDEVKKGFETALDAIKEISKDAPDEIKGDIEFVSDKYNELFDIIKDNDYDVMKAFADPKFAAIAQDEEVSTRGDKLDDYLKTVCGLTDDSEGGTGDTVAG